MGHELEIVDGKASLFLYDKAGWHGLGNVVKDAPDSKTAIKLSGMDFRVTQEPVYLSGIDGKQGPVIPNLNANVRDTDRKVLGYGSDRYLIVQPEEAFAFTDTLLGEGVVYETAGVLFGGRRIFITAKLPEALDVLGDRLDHYLLFGSSFDGSSSLTTADIITRVVCWNTYNIALEGAKRTWKSRHTGKLEDKIQEAHRTLKLAETYGLALKAFAEKANAVTVTAKQVEDFMAKLFGDAKKAEGRSKTILITKTDDFLARLWVKPDLANFRDLKNKTVTKWALANAVTDYAQHTTAVRKTENLKDQRLANLQDGDAFTDHALRLVAAL